MEPGRSRERSFPMAGYAASSDPTRSPRNSLIAAGLLVAVTAVLVGFHATTMVLSLTDERKPEIAKSEGTDAASAARPAAARPVAAPAQEASAPQPAAAPAQEASASQPAGAPAQAASAPPLAAAPAKPVEGIAAQAKARALAAIEDEEPQMEERERSRPRRSYRAPRIDKHKVY